MKIVNTERGEAYQLKPDTQLSVERTNPFFNDYGEQTVPCNIPSSAHNLRLLGHPSVYGRTNKLLKGDVTISSGDYYAVCRQAVLGIKSNGDICTSFYMNDGSLYTRMQKVKLKSIYDGEYVKDYSGQTITTVSQGIAFCRQLLHGTHPDYAIFPVLVEDDSGMSDHYYKCINFWGRPNRVVPSVFERTTLNDPEGHFWGETEREEYVDGSRVSLSPGYYISPFIRCNTVLRRIFSYFGYTLNDSFLTRTEPFTKMVFVNNVIDTLVNGTIRVSDLLPDVTVNVILDVFRRKFCCEFSVNEAARTVDIVFLKDMVTAPAAADLTNCVTADPECTFNTKYHRVVLSSKDKADSETGDSFDDLTDMVKSNPTAEFNQRLGTFVKTGYLALMSVTTVIGSITQSYNTGEALDPEEVEVPDMMPDVRRDVGYLNEKLLLNAYWDVLFIGKYNTLNSKMTTTASTGDTEATDTESASMLKPILAFAFIMYPNDPQISYAWGTIHNYHGSTRLWDYSLCYNGPDGIYSRFWSFADRLYRNALDDVKVELLLTDRQKMELPAVGKVTIHNTEFLINKLKFAVGGKNKPIQSELKSLHILQPEDNAPGLEQLLPMMSATYRWEPHCTEEDVTKEEYDASDPADRDRSFNVVYPPVPHAGLAGQRWFEQKCYLTQMSPPGPWGVVRVTGWTKVTVWLECVPK